MMMKTTRTRRLRWESLWSWISWSQWVPLTTYNLASAFIFCFMRIEKWSWCNLDTPQSEVLLPEISESAALHSIWMGGWIPTQVRPKTSLHVTLFKVEFTLGSNQQGWQWCNNHILHCFINLWYWIIKNCTVFDTSFFICAIRVFVSVHSCHIRVVCGHWHTQA